MLVSKGKGGLGKEAILDRGSRAWQEVNLRVSHNVLSTETKTRINHHLYRINIIKTHVNLMLNFVKFYQIFNDSEMCAFPIFDYQITMWLEIRRAVAACLGVALNI